MLEFIFANTLYLLVLAVVGFKIGRLIREWYDQNFW